ncbi:MAG: hypothetical protein LUF86_06565, partial [Clostridiales bacterium]|nr:hypothetical protein [Clostridiales bacterium]
MKKYSKSALAYWLLALAMVLSLLPTAALAADEAEALTPAASSNTGDQNYISASSTVKSYLTETDDGLMRVEYISGEVVVEYYDSKYTLTGTRTIECELTTFGGFYAGEDAYYLVFGQSNPEEDSSVEVLRVVKYSTDWVRQGQASLYGANTYVPFSAGSCRITEYGGYLYIRTCHTMYTTIDGLHHQANMMVVIQESSMEVTGYQYGILNNSIGYVSHSFNQFILVDDDGKIIALDHGDAYPRTAILFRYTSSAGSASFSTSNSRVSVFRFEGDTGENYTGASLGGLEYSSTSYLVAGNSVTQDDDWSSHTARNVFVTVTDRDNFTSDGTTVKWITQYDTDGDISASTPQLVKLDSDSFLLLWTTTKYLDSSTSYSKQTKL